MQKGEDYGKKVQRGRTKGRKCGEVSARRKRRGVRFKGICR